MEIHEQQQGKVLVVAIAGRLDSNTAPEFDNALAAHIAAGHQALLIDCGRLEYISSAGLRVFIKTVKALRAAGGALAACAMQDHVREVFEISGFDAFVPIHGSREEGLAAIG